MLCDDWLLHVNRSSIGNNACRFCSPWQTVGTARRLSVDIRVGGIPRGRANTQVTTRTSSIAKVSSLLVFAAVLGRHFLTGSGRHVGSKHNKRGAAISSDPQLLISPLQFNGCTLGTVGYTDITSIKHQHFSPMYSGPPWGSTPE